MSPTSLNWYEEIFCGIGCCSMLLRQGKRAPKAELLESYPILRVLREGIVSSGMLFHKNLRIRK
ncbi:MAG: hypothetical protein ACD_13C00149G0001 [uncultured bacterium]|nr:MAG: hypothetical protein ACD_13C00149G0001 [uncultured bacterium]